MTTRRQFLKTMGAGMAGVALSGLPSFVQAAPALMTSHETADMKRNKVRVAFIGIGNRGEQDFDDFLRTDMVEVAALCDVDLDGKQCQKVLSRFPKVKRFRDFRELFEKAANDFDAVVAAVPDHIHFPIAMMALTHGKHIYLEKPMVRTFLEAELLMQMARRHPELATQVGNQGHSEANYFQFKAWQEAGIIKDVTAVTAHMNNSRRWHRFDPAMKHLPEAEPLPQGMDWDTWLGAAQWHDYSSKYHQGEWRSWYDFGMGALGDWGAHILDTVHEFLDLGLPYEVTLLNQKAHNDFFFPYSSTILFRFGARGAMPPVDITWYDGLDNLPTKAKRRGQHSIRVKSSIRATLFSRVAVMAARSASFPPTALVRWQVNCPRCRRALAIIKRTSSWLAWGKRRHVRPSRSTACSRRCSASVSSPSA